MKNRLLKYFLLTCVLIVWGIVIYKIIVFNADPEQNTSIPFETIGKSADVKKSDTFKIYANYPDPFLRNNITRSIKKNSVKTGHSIKKSNSSSLEKIVWPNIIYNGFVSNNVGKKTSVLLHIDGKSFSMKKGAIINGLELIEIGKDSLKFRFSGSIKYIRRYDHNKK